MNSLWLLCIVAVGIVHAATTTSTFDTLEWCIKSNNHGTHTAGHCHYDDPTKSGFFKRPTWAGSITIDHDEITDNPHQVWNVSGIVIPISTPHRATAPHPWNGFATGSRVKKDKGHVIALSLGGPDVSENIVPQCNYWQRNNEWRDLETTVEDYALCKYGLTHDTKPHPSEVGDMAEPQGCKVVFTVEMSDYNDDDGEAQTYTGSVKCGSENYPFTISRPEYEKGLCKKNGQPAVWSNGEPPKTDCTAPPTVAQSRRLTPAPTSGGNGKGTGSTGVPPRGGIPPK